MTYEVIVSQFKKDFITNKIIIKFTILLFIMMKYEKNSGLNLISFVNNLVYLVNLDRIIN